MRQAWYAPWGQGLDDRAPAATRKPHSKKSPRSRRKGSGTRRISRTSARSGASAREQAAARRIEEAQRAIGNFLRATRAAQNLTQAQVATMTLKSPWKLSRAAISAIERGQNFPGMEAMLALSYVLHVDPKELVERARLSTVVPVDITGLSYDELDRRASRFFWAGEFRKAISVYDAILEKLALEPDGDQELNARRVASLEVRRATALKRAGALLAAIATVERAISLAMEFPEIQAEAYVVLAGLQGQRGHLPLAHDAAQRAIELCEGCSERIRGWAWMSKARVEFLSGNYEGARQSYREARQQAELAGDHHHLTHIDGDIGSCYLAEARLDEARQWIKRAVTSARVRSQPALEASWLVELGKVAFHQGRLVEADGHAEAALKIARPREQLLTVFRAEWLRHQVNRRKEPTRADNTRLARLRKLFVQLDQHEGIDEIQDFRRTAMRGPAVEKRKGP